VDGHTVASIDAFQGFNLLFGVVPVLPATFHFAETSGELNRKAKYQAGEGFRPISKYNLKAQRSSKGNK
jgi:hypothetical protein